jgi:hypothetical protein
VLIPVSFLVWLIYRNASLSFVFRRPRGTGLARSEPQGAALAARRSNKTTQNSEIFGIGRMFPQWRMKLMKTRAEGARGARPDGLLGADTNGPQLGCVATIPSQQRLYGWTTAKR